MSVNVMKRERENDQSSMDRQASGSGDGGMEGWREEKGEERSRMGKEGWGNGEE